MRTSLVGSSSSWLLLFFSQDFSVSPAKPDEPDLKKSLTLNKDFVNFPCLKYPQKT